MTLNKKSYVIKKMVQLIELGINGNASNFAEKLSMSRSQLFIEIEKFKSLDVEINFDTSIKSFVFTGNKRVIIHKPIEIIDNSCLSSINGGKYFAKNSSVLFSGRNNTNLALENS